MVVKYDLEDAELHGLSSLYKFVIAKSIVENALETNRLDTRHRFDHLRFYSRLSLKHAEGARLFVDPSHKTLYGVELSVYLLALCHTFRMLMTAFFLALSLILY